MPGKHSEKTKLLGFYADINMVARIDQVRGADDRSQFLRDAVVEYMVANKIDVPEEWRRRPDRAGKGGPTKYKIKRKRKGASGSETGI